jgi:nucleotide-binding universal stress UspA family protein
MFSKQDVAYSARKEVGHPAEVITRIAADEHFDLIVVGSRGLSGFQLVLLGSVSHHARCPVLIVK